MLFEPMVERCAVEKGAVLVYGAAALAMAVPVALPRSGGAIFAAFLGLSSLPDRLPRKRHGRR